MHMFLVAFGALCVTLMAATGIAALATGWVMPRARSKVLQPRLWGCGALTCAVGWGLFTFLGPFSGPPHGAQAVVAWCGWVAFMGGLGVQFLAQRPGRTQRPTRTVA
ncbi:hypothetical protein ACFY1U_08585 [Streptomyces sp. NPDC001351]|uniref:hypothetical protein n=1 Tax=Streptomyces sp. NPDC001351 TaxID=3364564 RepID=UPI0036AD65AE